MDFPSTGTPYCADHMAADVNEIPTFSLTDRFTCKYNQITEQLLPLVTLIDVTAG